MYMNEELIQEKLEEMNATKIQKLDSQMYLVNFDLKEDMRISYVFNITREGKYFLQRMPVFHGMASSPMNMRCCPSSSMMLRSSAMQQTVPIS